MLLHYNVALFKEFLIFCINELLCCRLVRITPHIELKSHHSWTSSPTEWWNLVEYGGIWWNFWLNGGIWWNQGDSMVQFGRIFYLMVESRGNDTFWWNRLNSGIWLNLTHRWNSVKFVWVVEYLTEWWNPVEFDWMVESGRIRTNCHYCSQ